MQYRDPYAEFEKLTSFRPIYTKERTAQMIQSYQRVPHAYKAPLIDTIAKHADHHKLPFQQYQIEKEDPFSVLRGIRQLSEGWLSGFSTFHVGREEPASNRFERIMRAVGDVSGFAGFIPATPFKALKLGKLAQLVTAIRGKSIPLLVSGAATRKVKGIAKPILEKASVNRVGAFNDAAGFLLKDVPSHVAEGAFNLGIASAVGSWQQGLDAMLHGGLQGAAMGGVFRGLGNVINRGGIPVLDKKTGKYILTATQKEDRILRGAAGALYTGLPSTLAGQTTEEQVYEYLLGAFFGSREASAVQHKAQKFGAKLEGARRKDPKKITNIDEAGFPFDLKDLRYDPQLVPGFKKLSKPVQKAVLEDAKTRYGTWGETFSAMGISVSKGGYEGFREDLKIQRELKDAVKEAERLDKEVRDEYPELTKEKENKINQLTNLRTDLIKKYKITPDRFNEIATNMKPTTTNEIVLKKDPAFQEYKDGIFGKETPTKESKGANDSESVPKETKDSDIGEAPVDVSIENISRKFVNTFMKDAVKDLDIIDQQVRMRSNAKILTDLVINRVGKDGKKINSNELIEDVETQFNTALNKEAKNELRQHLIRKTMDVPIKHYSVQMIPYGRGKNSGVAHKLMPLADKRPENIARNSKDQRESAKLYDEVYKVIADRFGLKPEPTRRPWVVIDHFTMRTREKGYPIEKNIKDINSVIFSKKKQQEFKSRILRDMAKQGYYYYGGKGDTGRWYFYSYHPEAINRIRSKKYEAVKEFVDIFGKKKSIDRGLYEDLKNEFIKEYTQYGRKNVLTNKEAAKYFDNTFLSNIMWNVDMNGLSHLGYKKGLEFLLKQSDIKDLKGFNKRSQIWGTDGYSLEANFLKRNLLVKGKTFKREERNALNKGKIRYILINDAEVPNLLKDSKASLHTEATDGAILIHPAYINGINEAFGMPYSGQNKSFIVSPDAKNGALLGKFMFHKASGRAAKWMEKQGLGMVMYKSAAKDTGKRDALDLDVDANFKVTTSAPLTEKNIYELPMEHIKGSLSEKQSEHMVRDQNTPKQLMQNIVRWAHSEVPQKTIDNMFKDWIETKYQGNEQSNIKLREFLKKDPNKVSEVEFQDIINDMENYSLPDLLNAVKNTKNHRLVTQLYKTILKRNAKAYGEMKEAEEISAADYTSYMNEVREFNTAIERMFDLNPHVSIFLYKDARNYLNKALRNFAVYQVTRPKQPNSISVRMRPYDPWLRQEKHMKEMETNDNIFYLDNLFKKKMMDVTGIITPKKGKERSFMTLEELWNDYGKDPKVKDFFETISMRVPMDSMSGAHKLMFGGFTGINGHGAVFHPRTMKALGGADLDGDKAFTFFGMKPEYKDVYHKQKFEFEKDGKIKDNKKADISKKGLKILKDAGVEMDGIKTFEDLLTKGYESRVLAEGMNSELGMYTPGLRMQISENAAAGRDQLGPAVVSRQVLFATHAELMNNPTQRYRNIKTGQTIAMKTYKIKSPEDKKNYRADNRDSFQTFVKGADQKRHLKWVYITPRKDKESLKFARELARAEIAYGSDPLDVHGLVGRQKFHNYLYHSLFKVQAPKGFVVEDASVLRKGMFRKIHGFNAAYFSRDYRNNRQWTTDEVSDMASAIKDLGSKGQKNTFLPKMVELLEPLDISDDILTRYDKTSLRDRYLEYDRFTKELNPYLKILNRNSFKVVPSPFVATVLDNNLANLRSRQDLSKDPQKFFDLFKKNVQFGRKKRPFIFKDKIQYDSRGNVIADKMWKYVPEIMEKELNKYYDSLIKRGSPEDYALNETSKIVRNAERKRSLFLSEFLTKASDFAQNDMMDRTSGQMLKKYIERYRNTGGDDSFIRTASNFAEGIKQMERIEQRKAMNQELEESVIVNMSKEGADKVRHILAGDSKSPAWEVRRKIDNQIQDFKDNNKMLERKLNRSESDLVDAFILNSYYKGNTDKITSQLEKLSESMPEVKSILDAINKESSGTFFSKAGVNSEKVSDHVLKDYLQTFQKEFEAVSLKEKNELSKLDIEGQLNNEMPLLKSKGNPDPIKAEITENDLEGLRHVKILQSVDPAVRAISKELGEHLKFYNGSIGRDINVIARGMIGKNLDAMDLQDMRTMNNMFADMRSGNWFMRDIAKLKDGMPKLSKRHWLMFPRAVSEEMMVKDFMIAKEQGFFKNYKGETAGGVIGRPTHFIERTQFIIGEMNGLAIMHNQSSLQEIQDKLRDRTGYESVKEGYDIHDMAFIQREKSIINDIKTDKYKTVEEKEEMIRSYTEKVEEISERIGWDKLKDKEIYVQTSAGKEKLTGQQLADRISDVYTELAISRYKRIRGAHWDWNPAIQQWEEVAPDPLSVFFKKNKKGNTEYWDKDNHLPKVDTVRFFNHIMSLLKEGKPIPMKYGLDGMRKVAKSIMFENKILTEDARSILSSVKTEETGHYKPHTYNPHIIKDPSKAREQLEKAIKRVKHSDKPEAEKKKDLQRLVMDYHRLSGDYIVQDVVDWHMYQDVLSDINNKKKDSPVLKAFANDPKAPSMYSRRSHLAGWETDPHVWETYDKNLIDTYYRQVGQIMSRQMFNEFTNKYKDKMPEDLWQGWSNFYADYINGAQGYPNYIPDEWLNGSMAKYMNVKGTPYAWWADNNVAKIVNNVATKLGLAKGAESLPAELRKYDVNDLRNWSNLEAKYQMAALLAHPKSAIGNLYGGTMHTIESTGWKHFKDAGNIDFIKTNLPKMKDKNGESIEWTKEAIDQWVVKHGIIPEYMVYEAGLNPALKSAKWKRFMEDATSLLKKDPKVKDDSLKSIARKYNITDTMFEKAAWFMREPERHLRRRAFVAHYLQAKEHLGNAEIPLDHPFLINKAKKGVQATQFLYSAPYRPAFSRTSLGKVMTRFQTWAWNSVRFRNDVIKEARQYGYTPGSPEFERFKRMQLTDAFVFSLANVFAYSLFEAALPAPYSWFQDTADWLFGDEKERDRAFFGQWPTAVAPLQMVTPPILRMAPATFSAISKDDYSKLSGYYAWSMFPFGRLAYDAKGIIQNPMMTVEKMTGLPYIQFSREAKKYRETDE